MNFREIIQKLAQDKGVSEEKIKSAICQSFCQFYEQKLGQAVDLHFEFEDKLLVYRLYKIVEKVDHPEKEIASSDPRLKEGRIENNTFFLPLETAGYSSDLVSEVEKRISRGLKEISWKSQFKVLQKFQQEEKLVEGDIHGLQDEYYLVNLDLEEGKVIGFWKKEEWTSSRQRPRLGQRLWFLVKQVNEEIVENQPPLLLTRASDAFFLQVLKFEIPELEEGTIAVRQITRLPGLIEITVESKKAGVDPVGACIGVESLRIKKISYSLLPERINIVHWRKTRKNFAESRKIPEEVGSYKNIQLRISEETSEKKVRPWTKKFNTNK